MGCFGWERVGCGRIRPRRGISGGGGSFQPGQFREALWGNIVKQEAFIFVQAWWKTVMFSDKF